MNTKEPLVRMAPFALLLGILSGLGRFGYDLWVYWRNLREGVPAAIDYGGLGLILGGVFVCVQLLVISYLLDRFQRRR